jgi:DNA-directed RNA polymerase III subunit RPC2
VQVDIEYTVGRQIRTKRGVHVGRLPIMLRSNRCLLAGASESELTRAHECPLDPGGYFIVRGTEKVILIQEQLSKNRMLVELDSDGDVMATVTSSDHERKTITKLRHKRDVFVLAHTAFDGKGVNAAAVLRAMGVESDQARAVVLRSPTQIDLANSD